jgi:transcriptional regulator with XRE-family HTH domain
MQLSGMDSGILAVYGFVDKPRLVRPTRHYPRMAKTRVAPDPNVGRNIAALMAANELLSSQPALARKTGVAQSTIGRILRAEVNASGENLRKIADAFRVSVDVLYLSKDDFGRFMHSAADQPFDEDPSNGMSVAQSLSHPLYQDVPTTMKWGDLRMGNLPAAFGVHLPDDSMAPEAKAGALVWFERDLDPRPGDWVLVFDATGHPYLREYRQRRPGQWYAHALNPAFEALEPERDGLKVAAVFVGMRARRG